MIPFGADVLLGTRRPVVGILHIEELLRRRIVQLDLAFFERIHQLLGDLVAGIHLEIRFGMEVDRGEDIGQDHDADDQNGGDRLCDLELFAERLAEIDRTFERPYKGDAQ